MVAIHQLLPWLVFYNSVKLCILFFQIRHFSSENDKVIELSYKDIEPVYEPIKKEDSLDLHEEEVEPQHSINSVCHL